MTQDTFLDRFTALLEIYIYYRTELEYHNIKYYEEGKPEISDDEYDSIARDASNIYSKILFQAVLAADTEDVNEAVLNAVPTEGTKEFRNNLWLQDNSRSRKKFQEMIKRNRTYNVNNTEF